MRKTIGFLLAGALLLSGALPVFAEAEAAGVAIDAANFPDENFRSYISKNVNIDKDRNGSLSAEEIKDTTYINVDNQNISSLKGIEYFTSLEHLLCQKNNLTELDVSSNTALTELLCTSNNLTSLDLSKNTALKEVLCYSNNLTSLDVSNSTALTKLSCSSNNLTTLDLRDNTSLTELWCDENDLTTLDVSHNTALTLLICRTNKLTTLDVSKNTELTNLELGSNNLTEIDVSKNTELTGLNCYENNIAVLDVSHNTALEGLHCSSNDLTTLDVSHNTALKSLSCSENNLTTLDVSKNTELTNLELGSNNLTEIDVSKNTELTNLELGSNNLTEIDVSKNTELARLDCSENDLKALDVSNSMALTELNCYLNNITTLDLSNNTSLTWLWCFSNNLTVLDVGKCTALTELNCDDNNIEVLDVSKCTELTNLSCYLNNIKFLDVSNCTALTRLICFKNNIAVLDVSKCTALTELDCYENNLTSLDISNCTVLNRLSCSANYIKRKSDIKGLNEESMTVCHYADQNYDGYECKYESVEYKFKKVLTGERTNLIQSWKVKPPTGTIALEDLINSEGIVFIPYVSELEFTCSDPNVVVGNDNSVKILKEGTYTLTLRCKDESDPFTDEVVIEAIAPENHTSHEWTRYTPNYQNNDEDNTHFGQCFCGAENTDNPEPHDFKLSYNGGGQQHYKNYFYRCTVCDHYKNVGVTENVVDEETGIFVMTTDGSDLPEGSEIKTEELAKTDTSDFKHNDKTAKVYDIKVLQNGVEVADTGKLRVTLPVPEGVDGATASVYRKESDGTYTKMNTHYIEEDNCIYFETEHLSVYIIAGGLKCDFDDNGTADAKDIEAFKKDFSTGNNPLTDMNGDGSYDHWDISELRKLMNSKAAKSYAVPETKASSSEQTWRVYYTVSEDGSVREYFVCGEE